MVAAFEKQKTTAEISEILKTLYHGGNGLGSVSAWYAEDGIHLSHGKSVRYDRSAQVISWESAAERIGELLESGQFASNVELAEAAGDVYKRQGQTLSVSAAIVKEGKSSPPQHFTEDTLLSAMETAGKEDMPEDAERKGLGTPATRAGILEKLVSAGFLERKKSRKTVQLLPSHDAVSLITVLPEQLQSPLLTRCV